MPKRKPLLCQHLENVSRDLLEQNQEIVREYVRHRQGVYALYRRGKLYCVGLAGNRRSRLAHHLKDRHHESWDRFSVHLTIGDSHLRELELLILRIVKPAGNKQKGKFAKSEDLRRRFKRDWYWEMRLKPSDLLGRQHRPAPQNRKAVEADGRQPDLGAGVLRRVYDCFTYFTSLFTTLISLVQRYFRVMVRRRLGERPSHGKATSFGLNPASGSERMVEAAGIEPASLANKPAATTCLVRRGFSAARWRPNSSRAA